ncbi:toll/interleukin-1 receptor domain-containing protein [Denitromonas iodatirespirans]|uniref:Toll/interleukin-1 receptor domain-containing protein n=1 Tax=Denitromonas iodatirespirans TaxID=2795389 RepID=A0A944HG25_DENI1|nr:toll/interleukin-1 receptor domain-containing protein [Denitromonas iodatirespirans]MBT0964226.1 toll/interleukin-1 receptor domain-containing protein [Denitromonas iodatirespirans]
MPAKDDSRETAKDLRYRAFLSYRSVDRKLAEWVHRKLEAFRLPRKLVGTAGAHGPVPRRIAPVFQDRADARVADDLETVIRGYLRQSEHLIVLCTPAAAAPESWVSREIEIFREERPGASIHAVIGGGEPPACFPPVLLTRLQEGDVRAPLAADLRLASDGGDGRSKAVVKLVAGIAGVDFDDLWQREKRKRMIRLALAGLGIVSLVIAGGLWWRDVETSRLVQIAAAAQQIDRKLEGELADLLFIASTPAPASPLVTPNERHLETLLTIARRSQPSYVGALALLHADELGSIPVSPQERLTLFEDRDGDAIWIWDTQKRRPASRLPLLMSDWRGGPPEPSSGDKPLPIALHVTSDRRSVLSVYSLGDGGDRIAAHWTLGPDGICATPCRPANFKFVVPQGSKRANASFEFRRISALARKGDQVLYESPRVWWRLSLLRR